MNAAPPEADLFRLLGDETRLRIVRLLGHDRLNATELTRILGLAQSTVSRHLGRLRDGGIVREQRAGGWTWFALVEGPADGSAGVWSAVRAQLTAAPDRHGDDARLAEARREREERRVGWGPQSGRPAEPGRSWSAWARALGHLLPALDVADVGAGEGALTLEIARWARRVVAVEADRSLLRKGRRAERAAGVTNVTWLQGRLDALPLADEDVDVALLSQVLHAVEEPAVAVSEAARVVRPGGRVLLLDLRSHEEDWVQDQLAHRWTGFEAAQVVAWLESAGLQGVRVESARRRRGNPFVVLVASGRKPGAPREDRDDA